MNRKEFYQEIGNIDDDLIQAANEVYVYKKNRRVRASYRIAVAAACFCLICGGVLFGLLKDTVYFNDISIPMTSKVIVPADENAKVVPMTYQELLTYYGIDQLPDVLGNELTREKQSYFVLYQDQAGDILCDTNILYYSSRENNRTVSVTFAKAEELIGNLPEGVKRSKIDGVSMVLASAGESAYWAGFKWNGISVKIMSDGLSEDGFIDIVKELIGSTKSV